MIWEPDDLATYLLSYSRLRYSGNWHLPLLFRLDGDSDSDSFLPLDGDSFYKAVSKVNFA